MDDSGRSTQCTARVRPFLPCHLRFVLRGRVFLGLRLHRSGMQVFADRSRTGCAFVLARPASCGRWFLDVISRKRIVIHATMPLAASPLPLCAVLRLAAWGGMLLVQAKDWCCHHRELRSSQGRDMGIRDGVGGEAECQNENAYRSLSPLTTHPYPTGIMSNRANFRRPKLGFTRTTTPPLSHHACVAHSTANGIAGSEKSAETVPPPPPRIFLDLR